MNRSITFDTCRPGSGGRETLEFIVQAADSKPLTAAMKHSVTSFTVTETNLTTEACTFTLQATSEAAANTIRRNLPKFEDKLKAGYLEQVDMVLEAVTVKS